MLLVFTGPIIAFVLRKFIGLQHWLWYILLGGVPAWFGLTLARLHPALALCFIVPLLPDKPPPSRPNQLPTLHAFEHALKLPVDFGMFFFTLANAGVNLQQGGGPLTIAVVGALTIGKMIGVTGLVLLGTMTKVAPINAKIRMPDVSMIASMASIGLTVALFVAGEAFPDPTLQGEAKFGALLSGLMGFVCVGVSKLRGLKRPSALSFRYGASGPLAHRHGVFYRHRVLADANQLHAHPDALYHPSIFAVDRAQRNWQAAKARTRSRVRQPPMRMHIAPWRMHMHIAAQPCATRRASLSM